MDGLVGERPVEERQRGLHGLGDPLPVRAPARLEVLERVHDRRGARRGRGLALPVLALLKRLGDPPALDQKDVRLRPEELDLKERAALDLHEHDAVALGGADGLDAAAVRGLEHRGAVAARPPGAGVAEEQPKLRPRHHDERGLVPERERELGAVLRVRVGDGQAAQRGVPLGGEGGEGVVGEEHSGKGKG